jgi:YbbR domain-containing protein
VRFFLKHFSSIFISLVLAVLVWVAAVREQNPSSEADYNRSIAVEVISPREGFTNTAPEPEAVRLRLLAPESSWKSVTPSKFSATLNLRDQPVGAADIPITVTTTDPYIRIVEHIPATANVNIEPLKTMTMPVAVDIEDSPPLGYINRTAEVQPAEVYLTGPVSAVDQVVRAVVEVFIGNSKETLQTTRNVVVRDSDNRVVRDVTIEPGAVQVTIPIEQRFGYKDVSVRVNLEGQVASGYRVANIKVDPPTLTVVGNPTGLGQIAGLVETTPINLNQATESIVRTVPLNLPDGVTTVLSEDGPDNGPGGVQVTIEITPIEDGINLQRSITQQGIDPDYWWRASPDTASVFLSGPLTKLQSLRASDVEVLVDLFDLPAGMHVLQPTVFKPDGLHLDAIVPDTVEVTIGRTVTRPVLQEGLPSRYTWRVSPNNMDVLLSGSTNQLQSLRPSDVDIRLDLEGLQPGIYGIAPEITVPDGVEVDSTLPRTVSVTIELKPELRSTPTVTPTVEATAATPQAKRNSN